MEVALLTGLQGAGKSTFFRQYLAETHTHVSKDNFRNNRRPGRRQRHLILEALEAGRSVAVDNTNPTIADRAEVIELARSFGATTVCYFFPPDIEGSLARNAGRSGWARVPDGVIRFLARRFEMPTPGEGFDRFFEVRITDGGFTVIEVTKGDHEAGRV